MESFNKSFHSLIMYDIYLSKEGVALPNDIKDKIYSKLWSNESDKQKSSE
jgi:hypothetical protein